VRSALPSNVLPTSSKCVATWLVKLDTETALRQPPQSLTPVLALEATVVLQLELSETAEPLKDHPHLADHALAELEVPDHQDPLELTVTTEMTAPQELTVIMEATLQPATNRPPTIFASIAHQDHQARPEMRVPRDQTANQETMANQVHQDPDLQQAHQDRLDHQANQETQDKPDHQEAQAKSTKSQDKPALQAQQDPQAPQVPQEVQVNLETVSQDHPDQAETLDHQEAQEMLEPRDKAAAMERLVQAAVATIAHLRALPQAIKCPTYCIDLDAIKTVSCSPTSPAVFLAPLICILVHAKTQKIVNF